MYKNLITANLVIADVTGGNANVLFQLGMRLLIGQPTIIITSGGLEDLPVDIRNEQIILIPDDSTEWPKLTSLLEKMVSDVMNSKQQPWPAYKAFREYYAPVSPHTVVWEWAATYKSGVADKWLKTVPDNRLSNEEKNLIKDFNPNVSSTFPQTEHLRNFVAEYTELEKYGGQRSEGILMYTFPTPESSVLIGSVFLDMKAAGRQYFCVNIDGSEEGNSALKLKFYQPEREVIIAKESGFMGTVRKYEYELLFQPSKQGSWVMYGTMYYPELRRKLTVADVRLTRK